MAYEEMLYECRVKPTRSRLHPRSYNLMFIGALVSVLFCVASVRNITVSKDTSIEWLIWLFVFDGFTLFAGGYFTENRYRR